MFLYYLDVFNYNYDLNWKNGPEKENGFLNIQN